VRAYRRFGDCNGSLLAAGLSYYTIFALFPLLMVGFAVTGFVLSSRPELLDEITHHIRAAVPSDLGNQLIKLMKSAIRARGSVGVIGLTTAAWAGLTWMSHLRAALTEMWWEQQLDSAGFVRTKLSDLFAMVGTFLVMVATIGLTALGAAAPMGAVLRWLGMPQHSIVDWLIRGVSLLMSLLVSWLLFTWMIARMPRKEVSLVQSMRAGLLSAIGYEVFKQVASIYLQIVLRSPAGATFGPVLGLLVFAYITSYLVLFCTAWAATAARDPREEPVEPPAPAIIAPRVQLDEGLKPGRTLAAMAMGAVGALAFSRLTQGRR
jgi:membrane protein